MICILRRLLELTPHGALELRPSNLFGRQYTNQNKRQGRNHGVSLGDGLSDFPRITVFSEPESTKES